MVQALDAGAPPAAADPVEIAAVAYRVRPTGWVAIAEAAAVAVAAERVAGVSQQSLEQLAHLRRQLESTIEQLKQTRQKHRDEMRRLKSDDAELRHKLGDVRS